MAIIRNLVVKIGADISGLSKGLKQAQSKLMGISQGLTGIGTSLSMKVTAPLVMIASQALKTSAEFEQSMANAASVSGATGEELQQMTDVAREMGRTTVFSASQAADAMYYMASAGYKAEQMANAIEPILNLASATQNDLAFATDTVIASLNQFQLESTDAERVSNVFAAAIGASQATLEKLGTSMSYVGPVANSLGWDIEETAGALSVLYNAGYDGSMAGTALRQGLVALMNPTAKAKKVFKELGIELSDLDPTTNNFASIVNTLKEAGMDTAQAMQVFGARAGPGMMALLAQGGDAIEEMTKQITGTNSASEMAEKQVNTMQGSAKIMKSMMEDIAITIGDVLIPVIRELMETYITPLMTKFQGLSRISQETAIKLAMVAASIGPLFIVLGKVVKVGATLVKVIGLLANPVALIIGAIVVAIGALVYFYKTNEDFRNKVIKVWEKVKTVVVKAIASIKAWWDTNGTKVLESIQNVFQTIVGVISFCVGVVIGIIQKLVTSLMYLWENNKGFREAIVNVWNGIRQAITEAISFIVAWWEQNGERLWNKVVEICTKIWDAIVLILDQIIKSITIFLNYLKPIWEQLKGVFASLWELMQELWVLLEPIFIAIGAAVAVVFGAVIGAVNGIIQALGPLIQAVLDIFNVVIEVVRGIVALLNGDLEGAKEHLTNSWGSLKDFFSNLWQAILNFGKGFVDGFLGFFKSFGVDFVAVTKSVCGKVGDWFVSLWDGIKKGASNIWDAITGIFGKIGDWFSNLFKDAFNWGKNLINCIVDGINSAIEWVGDAIKSVGQKIKDFLGFHSPTKKGPGSTADEWMPNMMKMFATGIETSMPDIESAVTDTATTLSKIGNASGLQPLDNSNEINGLMTALSFMQSQRQESSEPLELSIDGQVFARIIMPSFNKELRRNGLKLQEV